MSRIDIWVHGRGRGHATRCAAIAARLARDGHELRAFAGADAHEILRPLLPTMPVDSLPPSLRLRGLVRLVRRVVEARRAIAARRPDVVVSDGDLPALLAARLCGVPGIAVGHGLVFAACDRPRHASRIAWWREAAKAHISSIGAQRRIAVGFVPLPVRRDDVLLARASAAPIARSSGTPTDVVAYFRDGVDALVLGAIRTAVPNARVFARGGAAGTSEIARADFLAALGSARAVVASAGSQLIAECIAAGLPMLAVYRTDDDEQRLNAEMLAHSGHGIAVDRARLDAAVVRDFLARAPVSSAPAWPVDDAAQAVAQACAELVGEARA
jgi:hypothetical protein